MQDLKPHDRVRVTIKDPDSGEVDTLDATIIAIDPTGILVAPDDTLMGLVSTLHIKPSELVSITSVTPQ